MNHSSKHSTTSINSSALLWGTFFLATSILLGAFAAHAVEQIWELKRLKTFQTGVQYQQLQGLGLLIIGTLEMVRPALLHKKSFLWAKRLLVTGVFLFSGCCYLYAFSTIKTFAMIVPFGGLSMIAGWSLLCFIFFRDKYGNKDSL
jgi:uncharacterized membrane protein YgdD (TMEM256/DUF423 family)